jgi:hypothetical protein
VEAPEVAWVVLGAVVLEALELLLATIFVAVEVGRAELDQGVTELSTGF